MTESIQIKQIGKDDVLDLASLEDAAFKGSGEDVFTLAMIAEIGWVFASLTDIGKMAGAIELLPTNKPGLAFIHGLIVEPEWQYNGIGTALIKYAENQAKNFGLTSLACTIATTNGPSLNAFINKAGFRGTEFHFDYYGPGEHRLWVEKQLDQSARLFPEREFGQKIKSGIAGDETYILDYDHPTLNQLLNQEHFMVEGVVRPQFSGLSKNCLLVSKN